GAAHAPLAIHVGCGPITSARLMPPPPQPARPPPRCGGRGAPPDAAPSRPRSEEHTSELQSRFDLVCRLLLEKKKTSYITIQWRIKEVSVGAVSPNSIIING